MLINVVMESCTNTYMYNVLNTISFPAMKRTTRGFDAKGNCSARTYEYLTPTFAFAKDYVSHILCFQES